MTIKYTSVV